MSSILKYIFTFILLTSCSGGFGTMDRIMSSWEGSHIDEVISQWGYPHGEQNIAGKKIYFWDRNAMLSLPSTTTSTAQVVGDTIIINSNTSGGGISSWSCRRTLALNDNNIVVSWGWSGNNCPFADIAMGYQHWQKKEEVLQD